MITFEQQCRVLITILVFFNIQKNSEHIVFYSKRSITFFNQLQKWLISTLKNRLKWTTRIYVWKHFFKKIVIILFFPNRNSLFLQNYQNIRFTNLQYRSKTWYLRLIHKINWFIKMFILNENIWCQSQFINKKLVFAFIFPRKYRMLQNLIFAVTKTTSFDRKCGVVISISLRTINQTNI